MSYIPQQIGWSEESKLLQEILKQLSKINASLCTGPCPTTTTTTTINYYYYSGSFCGNPLFTTVIRSLVFLSIDDVVLVDSGDCVIIGSTYEGPDYSYNYISTETCFVDPCPTTTTTTTLS